MNGTVNPLYQMFGNTPSNTGNILQNVRQAANLLNGNPIQKAQELMLSGLLTRSNVMQFAQQLQQDPEQQVLGLLNSGQMTQEQFNQLSAMAQEFQKNLR